MDIDGGNFAILHDFQTTDGSHPESGLIAASNGFLYGTTFGGGASGKGTIFRIDTAGSNFSTIRHLDGNVDGEYPVGRLVQADDTNLYGATSAGGAHNFGTLYRIDLGGTAFTAIHAFGTSTEGTSPGTGVIQGSDGLLYGATNTAAASLGDGTLFRCDLDGSGLTTIHAFAGAPDDGQTPEGELLEASDGAALPRKQMAVLLLRAKLGSGHVPPPADVPAGDPFAGWIEEIYAEGITGGCQASPLLYCPNNPNTRGQMAVFLVKAFGL